jgi:hypothetical protein
MRASRPRSQVAYATSRACMKAAGRERGPPFGDRPDYSAIREAVGDDGGGVIPIDT